MLKLTDIMEPSPSWEAAYCVATQFFPFGATAPIWAFAYLHATLRFTSVY
jgi:hypothetical protein